MPKCLPPFLLIEGPEGGVEDLLLCKLFRPVGLFDVTILGSKYSWEGSNFCSLVSTTPGGGITYKYNKTFNSGS